MNESRKSTKRSTSARSESSGFTAEERAAMKERAQELKRQKANSDGERDVMEKIAEMAEPDRSMAERLHVIIKACDPTLAPRTWYGMPAYAKEGDIVCFFQSAQKFKARYSTLGFSDKAKLDDGSIWPTAFALDELTTAVEERITELVKRAVR